MKDTARSSVELVETPPVKTNTAVSSVAIDESLNVAVILVNSGTPTEPNYKGVWAFLKALLADPRVVEVPRPIWLLILTCFILPFRVPRMTKAYRRIWGETDSPLRSITRDQTEKLQALLAARQPASTLRVAYAMNYCGPDLATTISRLEDEGCNHFIVLPLYPQYSAAVTGNTYDKVASIIRSRRNIPQIHIIKQYYQQPSYIEALAGKIRDYWQQHGKPEKLLLSFHSLPKRYVDLGDPYYAQCQRTTAMLAEHLQLSDDEWLMSFQSRFIGGKWLGPYTSVVLEQWGREKVKRVDVFCPAFAADCLETIEEIGQENRERFLAAGGESYHMIPCLNDDSAHIEMMAAVIEQYLPRLPR